MSILGKIFTWWDGATIGTARYAGGGGQKQGEDALGNVYYQGKIGVSGHPRRWVIYKGPNDASRVPPEWHSWLHNTVDALPDDSLPPPRRWELEAKANLTGSVEAYRPAGALESGGHRAAATGDYEAWQP
jgi:NADH:ubiquinone oxidoreductase subunit